MYTLKLALSFESRFVGHPEDRFSCDEAQMVQTSSSRVCSKISTIRFQINII